MTKSKNPNWKKMLENQTGANNPNWKGGRYVENQGYWRVKHPEYHPRKSKDDYVFIHILAMEDKLGRYVDKEETIHHINLDKKDNRHDNLCLCKSSHQKIHKQLMSVVSDIIKMDIIKYNEEKEEYYIDHLHRPI